MTRLPCHMRTLATHPAPLARQGGRPTRPLAACGKPLYRWEGKVEKAEECLLLIKTGVSRFDVLKRRIQELHPYKVPEIIALPIIHGDRAYLNWITDSTK